LGKNDDFKLKMGVTGGFSPPE